MFVSVKAHYILISLFICVFSVFVAAQNEEIKIPDEVKPFVENGMVAIALESGDLNGDGTKDFILVLTKPVADPSRYDDAGDAFRPTLILTRNASGKLSVASRNDAIAFCRNCGGVMGDPFQGVEIQGAGFTVANYGGSNWRWSNEFRFSYSRRDKQWQLVSVKETSFNSLDPGKEKNTVYTPPKSFGLISFSDFDPQNFKRKGLK
jgi:hypothetical protein